MTKEQRNKILLNLKNVVYIVRNVNFKFYYTYNEKIWATKYRKNALNLINYIEGNKKICTIKKVVYNPALHEINNTIWNKQ